MGSLSHYKFYSTLGINFKCDFDDIPLARIGYDWAGDGCYFKPLSGSKVHVGLHKDLPEGERGSCWKGKPFLGFSIPLCKGKGLHSRDRS